MAFFFMNMFVCEQGGSCGGLLHGMHMGTAVKGNLKPKAGCAFVCVSVCALIVYSSGRMGVSGSYLF